MRAKRRYDKSQLQERQGFFVEGGTHAAHAALMRRVFGIAETPSCQALHWWVVARFDPDGRCVASAEARELAILLNGERVHATGLRRVAVDPDWRGQGLLRDLIGPTLLWCAERTSGPTLLFTEAPSMYAPYGFTAIAQHVVVGAPPSSTARASTRRLNFRVGDDVDLLRRRLKTRAPLSAQCALLGADDLMLSNILAQTAWTASYAAKLDAIILHENEGNDLTLVDIIAEKIPAMSAIVDALGLRPRAITVLFAPDRLDWRGTPKLDDTGLMSRGPLPTAMTRPFMLPPTAEF